MLHDGATRGAVTLIDDECLKGAILDVPNKTSYYVIHSLVKWQVMPWPEQSHTLMF